MSLAVAPPRYVRVHIFEALTGYSKRAVEAKIREGKWIEGRHYRKAPDGHILVDLKAYEEWVENQPQGA